MNTSKFVYIICDQIGNRFQTTTGGWVASTLELNDGEYIRSFSTRDQCDKHIKHYKNACSWGINCESQFFNWRDDGKGIITI